MEITNGRTAGWLPSLYSVARPVPLSETQTGVVGPWDRPHALTRCGSVIRARPAWSATRLTWVYPSASSWAGDTGLATAAPEAVIPKHTAPTTAATAGHLTHLRARAGIAITA